MSCHCVSLDYLATGSPRKTHLTNSREQCKAVPVPQSPHPLHPYDIQQQPVLRFASLRAQMTRLSYPNFAVAKSVPLPATFAENFLLAKVACRDENFVDYILIVVPWVVGGWKKQR